jgi:histidine ammonia-lyase
VKSPVWICCLLALLGAHANAKTNGRYTPSRVIELNGDALTIADIVDIAEDHATIMVSANGMNRIRRARGVIDHYIDRGLPAYGITTIYGADFQTTLPPEAMRRFGRINIIQEATKVGDGSLPLVDRGSTQAAWALLVNSFARGYSGASPETGGDIGHACQRWADTRECRVWKLHR